MNIQQEIDSLFEKALALLHESIKEPDKKPERRERLYAWNRKFRAVRRTIADSPLPRQIRAVAEQTPTRNTLRRRVLPSSARPK
jgi:hypothetical protein